MDIGYFGLGYFDLEYFGDFGYFGFWVLWTLGISGLGILGLGVIWVWEFWGGTIKIMSKSETLEYSYAEKVDLSTPSTWISKSCQMKLSRFIGFEMWSCFCNKKLQRSISRYSIKVINLWKMLTVVIEKKLFIILRGCRMTLEMWHFTTLLGDVNGNNKHVQMAWSICRYFYYTSASGNASYHA